MMPGACVGTVCGFAGQVEPVSGTANNLWAGLPCSSKSSAPTPRRNDIPLNPVEAQGWMLCDGRALSAKAYPELFAVLGHLYGGVGDTFNLPDYRGLFLRGADAGSGMDPDAAKRIGPTGSGTDPGIGSLQCDALQTHTHIYKSVVLSAPSQSGNAAGQASADMDTGAPAQPARTSTETRPKNISINYIIKFR